MQEETAFAIASDEEISLAPVYTAETSDHLVAYPRAARAGIDEVRVVHAFFAGQTDGVMLDVGAHHGSSLRFFANDGWDVHAFEPDPVNRADLEQRWSGHTNVHIDPRAVSESIQTNLPFFRSEESTGISSLSAFRSTHEVSNYVDTTTVADYCADHGITHIDLLKIDAEGHDLFVLKGVPWDRIKPEVVVCEFEDSKTIPLGYRFDDMAGYLAARGYVAYVSEWHPVRRYGITHDWRGLQQYPCKIDNPSGWGNLIAFRKDGRERAPSRHRMTSLVSERVSFAYRSRKAAAAPTTVAWYPPFAKPEALHDQLARAAFYLGSVELERVFLFYDGTRPETFIPPPGMDPAMGRLVRELLPKVQFVSGRDAHAVRDSIAASDIVFRWQEDDPTWAKVERSLHGGLENKRVFVVDKKTRRMEGSLFVEAIFGRQPDLPFLIKKNRDAFRKLLARVGRARKAYLFGTGPSANRYSEFDFSDGLPIVCNTIIRDEALMDWVRPQVLCFADPIFHFGCSEYAASFREMACRAAEKYDLTIVIPLKYYAHLCHLCPELEKRLIGVPFDRSHEINIDLRQHFQVWPIDNILTLLMIPLGVSLAEELHIIGCDGRVPDEGKRFWKHNAKTQIGELYETVRSTHPGFFDLDYQDYYDRHCDNLDRWLSKAEGHGVLCQSMVESYIPALRRRSLTPSVHLEADPASESAFRVVSINPDASGAFGHFLHHDQRIREQVEASGGEFLALISQDSDLDPKVAGLPVFTDSSWSVRSKNNQAFTTRFSQQLEACLREIERVSPDKPNIFMMYLGCVQHLVPLLQTVARTLPAGRDTFVLNVFGAHHTLFATTDRDPAQVEELIYTFRHTRALRARYNVHLAADSEMLADEIEAVTGERPASWPMFGVTDMPEPVGQSTRLEGEPLRVFCPATVQASKGYDLLGELAEQLDRRRIELSVRDLLRPGTPPDLIEVVEHLRARVRMIEGELPSEEFVNEVVRADVVLIPYRQYPFHSRTSGALADAIMAGKPVVSTRETWAGREVERLGIGETARDGDVAGFAAALRRIADDFPRYAERCRETRAQWLQENSAEAFVRFLRRAAENAVGEADTTEEQDLLQVLGDAVRYRRAKAIGDAQGFDVLVEDTVRRSSVGGIVAGKDRIVVPLPVWLHRPSRKLRKLVKTPRRFFRDSKVPGFKMLARLFDE